MSKPCTPVVHIKIAGKWMFIRLKIVLIGIDPYPYVCNDVYIILYNCTVYPKQPNKPTIGLSFCGAKDVRYVAAFASGSEQIVSNKPLWAIHNWFGKS